ncbi:MAG: hypothetical protein AAFQ98_12055 [Bacteroidota bacterium]
MNTIEENIARTFALLERWVKEDPANADFDLHPEITSPVDRLEQILEEYKHADHSSASYISEDLSRAFEAVTKDFLAIEETIESYPTGSADRAATEVLAAPAELATWQALANAPRLEGQGRLTRNLQALRNQKDQLNSISSLPPEADTQRQQSSALIDRALQQSFNAQGKTLDFIAESRMLMGQVQHMLDAPTPDSHVINQVLGNLQTKGERTRQQIGGQMLQKIRDDLATHTSQTNQIKTQLENKEQALIQQILEAQRRLAKTEQEKWYWLALGIFGLAGVAAAVAIIVSISNSLADLERQIRDQRNTQKRVGSFIVALEALKSILDNVLSGILRLENNLNLLLSGVNNIRDHLESAQGDLLAVTLFVEVINESLTELEVDAS